MRLIRGCESPHNFSPVQPASPSNLRAAPTTRLNHLRLTTTSPALLYDDGRDSPDPAQLESMIEQAAAQSAEILAVRHFAEDLVPHGHVAAVLRF